MRPCPEADIPYLVTPDMVGGGVIMDAGISYGF
jgi:hypothetical protein